MSTSEQDRFSMSELGRSFVKKSSNSGFSPHTHAAPFDKLSIEIIHEIFNLACPDVTLGLKGTPVPFHCKLGLVCQKWNCIVAGHHLLWATFEIDAEGESNPIFSTKLRNYLLKSGTCPLSIRIRDSRSEEVLSDILYAIIPHCERWYKIKFDFPLEYHYLQKLEVVHHRLPVLQHLRITGPPEPYPTGTQPLSIFRDALLLNRISVSDIDMNTARVLELPWNHVSQAKLCSYSFREMQSSLELSQTLTNLTLTEGYPPSSRSYSVISLNSPATLKELQVLRVRGNIGIEFLTCPSLKRLEAFDLDAPAIHKLLENSSCTLTHLELTGPMGGSFDHMMEHMSLAGLTFLHLENDWSKILGLLILDFRRLLPALETLHVNVNFDSRGIRGDRKFKLRIGNLQSVVDSRTYDRLGQEGTLSEVNASVQDKKVASLKECYFQFTRSREHWERWQEWALKCLRAYCDTRHVSVVLRQFYDEDVEPCDYDQCSHMINSDESDDTDGSDETDENDKPDPELEELYYQTFGRNIYGLRRPF